MRLLLCIVTWRRPWLLARHHVMSSYMHALRRLRSVWSILRGRVGITHGLWWSSVIRQTMRLKVLTFRSATVDGRVLRVRNLCG